MERSKIHGWEEGSSPGSDARVDAPFIHGSNHNVAPLGYGRRARWAVVILLLLLVLAMVVNALLA